MKPLHQHDCHVCQYLGSDKEYDFYFCHNKGMHPIHSTLIARYGKEEKYESGSVFAMHSPRINMALRLAVEQDILPIDFKNYIKDIQDNFLERCKTDSEYGNTKKWAGKERFLIK
jgi:hypothetical protein